MPNDSSHFLSCPLLPHVPLVKSTNSPHSLLQLRLILERIATEIGRKNSAYYDVRRLYSMSTGKSEKRDELLSTVRDALRRAELYCARTRRWDTRLLIIRSSARATATVLPGGTVIGESRHWRPSADGGFSVQLLQCSRHQATPIPAYLRRARCLFSLI